MIKITNFTKKFKGKTAVDKINLQIQKGKIYGLVAPNGSGKSTLLRSLCGVYSPDGGKIEIDEISVFENPTAKEKIFFVSDDMYFLPGSNIQEMAKMYRDVYPNWSEEKYNLLTEKFVIDKSKSIKTFSKGMKRQAAIILALSCQTEYLLLDEAFDGLDPVVRVAVRRIIADEIANRNACVIISSHNLRELEDFCDTINIMNDGKLILQQEIEDIHQQFCKVQFATTSKQEPLIPNDDRFLSVVQNGSVVKIVAAMSQYEMKKIIDKIDTSFVDYMQLTLEEVFIYEMEAIGYDTNNIIF